MHPIAIIGGTGLTRLSNLEIVRREMVPTPFGEPSGPVIHGRLCDREVMFLARHGYGHTIPPHKVNYRANIWALREIGVRRIVAVAAVGGIRADMAPGHLAIPDQIVDYTYCRDSTFHEGEIGGVVHIDFTEPYDADLRASLLAAGERADIDLRRDGTYAATQGPRLETAAEIDRLERDGCDVVGMTGMPEAALAREVGVPYACCAVVANWAAGRGPGSITMEDIDRHLTKGMDRVAKLLMSWLEHDAGD